MSRWLLLVVVTLVAAAVLSGVATAESYSRSVYYEFSCVDCVPPSLCDQHTAELTGNFTFFAAGCKYSIRTGGHGGHWIRSDRCGYGCGTWYAGDFPCRPSYLRSNLCDEGTYTGSCVAGAGAPFQIVMYRDGASEFTTDYWIMYTLVVSDATKHTVSGTVGCVDYTHLYFLNDTGAWLQVGNSSSASYSFEIYNDETYRLIFSNGVYHDFDCVGDDIIFDYDACTFVYGYTCGIGTIKLYKDDGGWVLDATEPQSTSYNEYEIPIVDGEEYLISFIDSGTVCNNQTFSCAGYHHLINFDRCNWVYPPSPWALPYIIYLWTGYDYNIVVLRDVHGNFIENSQIAIYDKTDNTHIHKWTDSADGYLLLGAMFDTDHDVRISVRTFDGVFTLDTTYPANGSAAAGDEDITTTNWTIPIMYNLDLEPVDQSDKPLFDVFCTLSEYTPFDPLSFWGMDLSDNGYVPVTNCSGFAMCDIVAEKDGYTDYNVTALNWTTRSALTKDYRHNIVMEAE